MALPAIGTLYTPFEPGNLPSYWSQPGGPGTQVFPAQHPGQLSAQYILGCGHASNILRIWEVYDSDTKQQAALVCCAACGYIQQIIEPYSQFQNYIQNPIVIA